MNDAHRPKRSLSLGELRLVKAVATIAVVALLYVYVIEPRVLAWMELETQIEQAEAEYKERSVLILHEDEIKTRFEQISKSMASKGSQSADTIDFYQLLSSLEIGQEFQIRDIRPVLTGVREGTTELSKAVLFCEGRVGGLETFLGRIARAEEALRVERLSLSIPAADSPAKVTLTVSKQVRRAP